MALDLVGWLFFALGLGALVIVGMGFLVVWSESKFGR